MSRICRIVLLVAASVVASASHAFAQTSYITGTVTDDVSGTPISGVHVTATRAGGAPTSTLTDGDGQYRLNNVAAGEYVVAFTRIGYAPATKTVSVLAGSPGLLSTTMHGMTLRLNPTIITASRREEKALDAPATVSVVSQEQVNERPSITAIDHVRGLPGVDVVSGGLQQANVVTRGFNNIFSGSLLTLTDNRYAFVPSLRVNVPYFSNTTNEDVERIEVVLGPAAALYGPNAVSGVMHVITKSPFDSRGTILTIDGGQRDYFRVGVRHAGVVRPDLAYKVSFEDYTGHDWESVDAAEKAIGVQRDFGIKKYGGEARLDWRPDDQTEITGTFGTSESGSALEPTGIGAAQVRDWALRAYQLRGHRGRLFAQIFMNESDAGQTFLLRNSKDADGGKIVDNSIQLVGQVQHGYSFGTRTDLIYGVDYLSTNPKTGGTINGRNEADDNFTEVGGYVHSTTHVASQWDVVAALRMDKHSRLDDYVYSPRAALVFHPTESHNIRITYNRAYSTPTTNNQFIDRLAGSIPIPGTPGYGVRALGTPATGFQFKRDCAGGVGGVLGGPGLCMRSPFVPGSPFIAAYAPALYAAAVAAILANPAFSDPTQRALLQNTTGAAFASSLASVGTQLRVLDPTNATFRNVLPTDVHDLDAIRPTISNTYELGYKGIIKDKLNLAFDVWIEKRTDFVGPLIVETPNVFLEPASLQIFLAAAFQAQGVPTANAQALAAGIAPSMAGIANSTSSATKGVPLGVVNLNNALSNPTDIVLAYRNFGTGSGQDVKLGGSDVSAEYLINDQWSVAGTYSYVSKDYFNRADIGGVSDIALNAPREKGTLTGRYHDAARGLSAELRARRIITFPANSGVYIGTVPGYTLLDVNVALHPTMLRGAMLSVGVTNLANDNHIEFIGAANIRRMLLTRLQYAF
jgi:iron complex outermembrane receptor protein